MNNISTELKVVQDNWLSVKRIWLAIQWMVGYLWYLCCSPSIFQTLYEDVVKKKKKKKKKIEKKKQTKRKKKKKLNVKHKIIVRRTSK